MSTLSDFSCKSFPDNRLMSASALQSFPGREASRSTSNDVVIGAAISIAHSVRFKNGVKDGVGESGGRASSIDECICSHLQPFTQRLLKSVS